MIAPGLLMLTVGALAAPAGEVRSAKPIAKLAGDLAYGICPGLVNGSRNLTTDPDLKRMGFAGPPHNIPSPRVPGFQLLGQQRSDGDVTIGATKGICQVNVFGKDTTSALAEFRAGLPELNLHFVPDPKNTKTTPGLKVETLMARVSVEAVIRVQFVEVKLRGAPMVTFQLSALDR